MSKEQDDLTVVYLWAKKEAEDEIKALRAENERLREALRKIAILDGSDGIIPQRGRLGKIARNALDEGKPFEDRWDNA